METHRIEDSVAVRYIYISIGHFKTGRSDWEDKTTTTVTSNGWFGRK